jgi:hypothetical protein
MRVDKNSSRRMNSVYAPNSQPRVLTRVCQGRLVTTDLPTLRTNSNSKQYGSATQEAKDLGTLRSSRWTVRDGRADVLRGAGGQSASHIGQSERATQTSSMHRPKFGRSTSSLQTVRYSRTVQPHRADGLANKIQPKPTSQMDRNEATQELAKNTTKTRLKGS